MIAAGFVMLALAAILLLYRVFIGPSLGDRVIALDGLLLVATSALTVEAVRTGRGIFVDAIVVVGLLGFVGTGVAARFIERQGG